MSLLLIAAICLSLAIGIPVGIVAGVRQARSNAKLIADIWDYEEWPPVVVAFFWWVGWPLALAGWTIYALVSSINRKLIKMAGVDRVASPAKIQSLERELDDS